MPRKLFKKMMPDPNWVRNHPNLRWLGARIGNPNLWHLSHRSVALAFLVGIFCAFLPMPFQMVVAAALAVVIGCNLALSVALVWISNPITMPAMLYFSYRVGVVILGVDTSDLQMEWNLDAIYGNFQIIWRPLILGSLFCGLSAGFIGFVCVRLLWIISVRRSWIRRGRERARRRQEQAKDLE